MFGFTAFFFLLTVCLQQKTLLIRYSLMSVKSMYDFFDEVDVSLNDEHTETSSHDDSSDDVTEDVSSVIVLDVSDAPNDELTIESRPLIFTGVSYISFLSISLSRFTGTYPPEINWRPIDITCGLKSHTRIF